ncbi:MAG: hypothetical protein ACKVTZ_22910 [Bacteroidia bacterium]
MFSTLWLNFSTFLKRLSRETLPKEVEEKEELVISKEEDNLSVETTPPAKAKSNAPEMPKFAERETAHYTMTLGEAPLPKGINAIIGAFSEAIPPSEVPTNDE